MADSSLNSALNLHGKLEKFPTYQSLLQRGNSKIFLNFCIMQLNCQILKYPKSGLVVYINCHRRKKMHRVQNRQFNSRSIHFWSQHKSSILQMYKKNLCLSSYQKLHIVIQNHNLNQLLHKAVSRLFWTHFHLRHFEADLLNSSAQNLWLRILQ